MASPTSYPLLTKIDSPIDLKKIDKSKLVAVCEELRAFLIETILENGGHFSANLGVVELTIALHYVFNAPDDKIIWDVGHQAYGHKVLTHRQNELKHIRKWLGISGFPKMDESAYDAFGTGHSSTSISAALGYAEAAFLNNNDRHQIAIIGDGSLTAGQAFEALNNAGASRSNVLIIVNDNNMGIDPNLGALNKHLLSLGRDSAEQNIFKSFGLAYTGPLDGHDLPGLLTALEQQRHTKGPRVLHIRTIKGKGYLPAEKEQTKWHSATTFVKLGAEEENRIQKEGAKYQTVFGETLVELADANKDVVGVTPAMPTGCSMNLMMEKYPNRVFDVGIAEQHAVTFAAGLAAAGKRPFCNIYSSFLQRAYDQVIHDVCLQNLPVIFCLDRAGVVGEDGPTHHGLYDLAFLKCLPNLVIAAPRDEIELRQMMFTAYKHIKSPMSIRYPRGKGVTVSWKNEFEQIEIGKAQVLTQGVNILLIGIGHEVNTLLEVNQILAADNLRCTVVNARFLAPLDEALIAEQMVQHQCIFTLEDGCISGGFGESVVQLANELNLKKQVHVLGFPNEIIQHGKREELFAHYQLDAKSIAEYIKMRVINAQQ